MYHHSSSPPAESPAPKLTQKNVLVLGARGFIGRRVVRQLTSTSWARPIAASRHLAAKDFEQNVDTLRLDAANRAELRPALSTAHAVISCTAGSAQDILECGTVLLETVAQSITPPKVVWLSSVAAYGSAYGIVSEQAPLLGDLGPYSAAKAAVDTLASRYPFTVRLRPGIVYGPESRWWSDRIARLLITRRLGDLGVNGNGICNLVHVDDVAAAAIAAVRLDCANGEAFNVGNPDPPSWNEYFSLYSQALGTEPLRPLSPTRVQLELRLLGPLLKIHQVLFPNSASAQLQPIIRPWLTTLCRQRIRMDVSKATSLLGLQWRQLGAGLEQTATWFLSGGRVP